jgi:hypothetical protein
MTNWEKNKKTVGDWGILPIDNVPKNILDYLKNNISDRPYNAELAVHLKKEYLYKDWPEYVNEFILKQISHPLLDNWQKKNNTLSQNAPFYVSSLWVNLQKKYEFNPVHNHAGIFSWIIFLKVPYDLKEEDKIFTSASISSRTSRLCFLVRDYMGDIVEIPVDVDKSFEGQMLMFPAPLQHLVYPFYTSDESRITVSGNIKLWVDNK